MDRAWSVVKNPKEITRLEEEAIKQLNIYSEQREYIGR